MSRSTAPLLKELFAGVHLVAITSVKKAEGSDLIVRFSNGQNKSYEKIYDSTGTDFLKMCGAAGTIKGDKVFTMSKDAKKSDLGARLWICIKEVWDVVGNEIQDTVNFYIFDVKPCDNPEKKPVIKGDPEDNKGVPSGEFYDTIDVYTKEVFGKNRECNLIYDESFEESVEKDNNFDSFDLPAPKTTKVDLPADKKKALADAREMIAKVESGKVEPEPKKNIFEKKAEDIKAKEGVDNDWDIM